MSIAGLTEKGKAYIGRISLDWVIVAIILLSSSAAFGFGYLAGKDRAGQEELTIELQAAALSATQGLQEEEPEAPAALPAGGQYVASKTGKSYHLPWCSGAKLIKEGNKVWFASKEEAEARGYAPAGNCPGI